MAHDRTIRSHATFAAAACLPHRPVFKYRPRSRVPPLPPIRTKELLEIHGSSVTRATSTSNDPMYRGRARSPTCRARIGVPTDYRVIRSGTPDGHHRPGTLGTPTGVQHAEPACLGPPTYYCTAPTAPTATDATPCGEPNEDRSEKVAAPQMDRYISTRCITLCTLVFGFSKPSLFISTSEGVTPVRAHLGRVISHPVPWAPLWSCRWLRRAACGGCSLSIIAAPLG